MRALGDSKTPLYFLILTSVLNIGLDLLFIVPFKMGILGAALATDISQAISGVISFAFLCRKFEVLHMQKGEWAVSKRACVRLMGIAGGLSLAGIGMLEDAGLRRFPLAFQMMVSAVLITAIELYSGMFSLRVLHYRMWDYSALPFSFCDGLICPWFFGIWYLLSAVGIFLTDYVSYYIFHEGTHPMYRKKKKGCAEGEFVIK